MKLRAIFFLIPLSSFVMSCNDKAGQAEALSYRVINVQPFSGISANETGLVVAGLKKIYPHIVLKNTKPMPAFAFYTPRNRYRADSLIHYLDDLTPEKHITIGLTNKDISTTKNGIADWGVMGLGYCPGKACIVSTYRLSEKGRRHQFFKVAIHELGHTEGLPHCPVKTCFMRDAEGGNPTNEEKAFCESCIRHLNQKGWNFNEKIN